MAVPTVTLHGGRAFVELTSDDGTITKSAVFDNVSVGVSYGHFEPFVIGRHSAGEVVITHMNPVTLRLSGYRKFDAGPYTDQVGMAKLDELVGNQKEITVSVIDRQNPEGKPVLRVRECKVVSHNFDISATQPSRLSIEIVGLIFEDEAGDQSNPAGDVNYR
jgi:hypothetical protein